MFVPSNYYTACTSTCTNVTTVTPDTLLASWNFDNNLFDSNSNYHGLMSNGSSYTPGYVDQALSLSNGPYVTVPSPFLSLTYRSFTIEAWINLVNLSASNDTSLFGQCHNFTIRRCLHYVIRQSKLYMGFLYNDAAGATNVSLNNWFHVGFVYDMATNKQSIYLNGILDGSNTTTGPYEGPTGAFMIGHTLLSNYSNRLSGYIDHVSIGLLLDRASTWISQH
jgi:Concanavalin A-like lectin/glucanases superfamily